MALGAVIRESEVKHRPKSLIKLKGNEMTREDALKKISELSCAYEHIRMTECPHCKKEVEIMVKMLMKEDEEEQS